MILNTRPEFYRDRFYQAFEKLKLPILDCPVLEAEPTRVVVPEPDAFDAVIFTSQFAISILSASSAWKAKKVFTVGKETARAARAAGFGDVTCAGDDVAGMESKLESESFQMALYACAEEVTKDLAEAFPSRVTRLSIYRMVPLATLPSAVERAVKQEFHIIVPLFSRRSAVSAAELFGRAKAASGCARLYAVGISSDIFAAEEGPWQCREVASSPTLDSVVEKTLDVAKSIGLMSKVKR